MKNKQVEPYRIYSLEETSELLDLHPSTLRSKISGKDPLIQSMKPNKIGREWRFLGENILTSLGSVTYQSPNFSDNQSTAGKTPQG